MSTEFVTYHTNTYNNLPLLHNLVKSFEECNVRDKFEWIVTDFGSEDGTRDYLSDLCKKDQRFTAILCDEKNTFDFLDRYDLKPVNAFERKQVVFSKSRNIARAISMGDIFVDISDDHQFFRKGDWISEFEEICNDRVKLVGKDDISVVLYRGLSHGRILKPNNRVSQELVTENGVPYFVALEKHYDDYHFMKRDKFELIGKFKSIEDVKDENILKGWREGNTRFNHYEEALDFYKEAKLNKIFLKYPWTVEFPNNYQQVKTEISEKLICPIMQIENIENAFKHLQRPVSSDEIFALNLSS